MYGTKKPRRTSEQKRRDDLVNTLCQRCINGYSINVMDIHYLFDAGKAAADGTDAEIEAAILAARDEYAVPR